MRRSQLTGTATPYMPQSRNPSYWANRAFLAIVLLAVVFRLVYIVGFGYTLTLNASGYDVYATNLMANRGYTRFADYHPDSDLPPLYSFFLVGVYTLFGRSAVNVALVQVLVDCVTLTAIYAIGKHVGGAYSHQVGLLATAFTAFYPYLLFQNLSVNDTALFIMLLAVGIWAVYRAAAQMRWAVFAGLIFGLAALTKTLVVLMLPIIALWWWAKRGGNRAFKQTVLLGIAFLIPILPWMMRNIALHNSFTLISTNDGSNLYQGNNPCVADYLLNGWDAQWVDCMKPVPEGLSELQEATWYREQAMTYLRENPDKWLRLFAVKLWTLWSPELLPRTVPPTAASKMIDNAVTLYETPLFQIARVAHLVYFTPLWALGLFGLWCGWRARRPIAPLVAVLAAITIAYTIYHPSTRYRSPGDPILFILAAYSVMWLYQRLRRAPIHASSCE